ncbi:testis-specific serine/threonine-protein kinase 3-like [Chironomus tepperi]|uniref:testis-specific serine/threonine-protein kinase 3-like n=1 Tax=Chironomus tepperi TaxID=113505 RepID=UPI00391F055D
MAAEVEKPEITSPPPELDIKEEDGSKINSTKSSISHDSDNAGHSKSIFEENGFTFIKKIGTGSYSKVKLAYSKKQNGLVAIKIVSKYQVPEEFLRRFLYNEIKVASFLKHENIIKYYQSIETTHRLYIIMQNAEHGSILDLIHKQKRIPEARACSIFHQILAGVEYCHSQGVAHRDIKCENILFDANYTVKLIDFGFAKCMNPVPKTADSNLSETYCGSYAYASPEILKGVPYDPFASDIWAMGCVLYTMIHGRLPFDDRNLSKLIQQVQAPITFSTNIITSAEFKACCRKIFMPAKSRISIEDLKNDLWVSTKHLEYERLTINRQSSSVK